MRNPYQSPLVDGEFPPGHANKQVPGGAKRAEPLPWHCASVSGSQLKARLKLTSSTHRAKWVVDLALCVARQRQGERDSGESWASTPAHQPWLKRTRQIPVFRQDADRVAVLAR